MGATESHFCWLPAHASCSLQTVHADCRQMQVMKFRKLCTCQAAPWAVSKKYHRTCALHTVIRCYLQHRCLEDGCPYMRALLDKPSPMCP